ncbi:Protein SRE-4 [Aphelenchoides avenae]|nr:Protein SRE-4 [Aphelenchus avenae]
MMSVSLIHPNLRMLICNIIVEYTLTGAARVADYVLSASFADYERKYVALCVLLRIVQDTSILVNGTTFLWIALERLMATLSIRTYESKTSRIGVRILTFAYLSSLAIASLGATYDFLWTDGFHDATFDSCQTSHLHPTLLPVFCVVAMVTYVFVLTLMVSLHRYNMRMKTVAHWMPLSARYQYGENVATLSVLVPSVVIWGIVLFSCTPLIVWYHGVWKTHDRDSQLLINQMIYLMAAFNSIVCPVAFVFKYEPLRKSFGSNVQRVLLCFKHRVRRNSVMPSNACRWRETDAHFQYLQDAWQTCQK